MFYQWIQYFKKKHAHYELFLGPTPVTKYKCGRDYFVILQGDKDLNTVFYLIRAQGVLGRSDLIS